MQPPLADAPARKEALDPTRSFIVQAPAGSGKTGLLTQRFLRLLALMDHPEEVVAVTYTRKAASEMQARILDAITLAAGPPPEASHGRLTWELGCEVLRRDQELGWQLLENPGRLRILTIDALCASLVRQAPALSGFGGRPVVAEEPQIAYRRSAQATLRLADGDSRWAPLLKGLLDHLDNNWGAAEGMLVGMLARRDQWLRRVMGGQELSRESMEAVLARIVEYGISQVQQLLPLHWQEELLALIRFALTNVVEKNPDSLLVHWREQKQFPGCQAETLPLWLALAELLLTGSGSWRKQFNVNNGFPPASAGRSKAEQALFGQMKSWAVRMTQETLVECDTLRLALLELRYLPPSHYADQQWEILAILLELLPMAAGQLKLIFAQTGEADFVEAAMGAALALGEPDAPSDLALRLDYRIRHILVDEFQDASHGQLDLLRRLTAGWTPDDGRTLFVVGDPMQSIYRFREADVGLFLLARREGIGDIALIPLSLSVNFRSAAGVVGWVNETFKGVFPSKEEPTLGAVSYSASHPFHPKEPGVAVSFFKVQDALHEADEVVALAAQARSKGDEVAILVRSRTHVAHILVAMRQAGLRYRAVEIEALSSRPVVRDLMTLTRAVSHPADRIAWFALLRAGWCGLTLEDLHHLSGVDTKISLWERMQDESVVAGLTADGMARLLNLRGILTTALQRRRRMLSGVGPGQMRRWLEATWQTLGGPATVDGESDLADAGAFFALVESMERGGEIPDFALFEARLAQLKAGVDPESDPGLLVMTIHKAKGLEFDVVILPALHKQPRRDLSRLLSWLEDPPGTQGLGGGGLLLAPVKRLDQETPDPIHAYVRRVEWIKAEHETGRLLYVAATRAKKRLFLTGQLADGEREAATGSFLARLMGAILDPSFFGENREDEEINGAPLHPAMVPFIPPKLTRLVLGWRRPDPLVGVYGQVGEVVSEPTEEPVLFDWAGESVRQIGLLVHRYLMVIAKEGLNRWDGARVVGLEGVFVVRLMQLGADRQTATKGAVQVVNALKKTLAHPRGRWILDQNHRESGCEFPVTGVVKGRLTRAVFDRLFVDEDETRWIVDFKTSRHAGGDLEGFLDNERVRYQDQLRRYGLLMQNIESRPIRLGLYFPLHSGWRECFFEPEIQ